MKQTLYLTTIILLSLVACKENKSLNTTVYQTSAQGDKLTEIPLKLGNSAPTITLAIDTINRFQTITGFGGSFTESSAYLLNKLSTKNRIGIIEAYFGEDGARYSLTRTHMNSCDFSLSQYSYAPVEGDTSLEHFSIEEDKDDIIPMIHDAMKASKYGFKIISSPWTAPPWMKDNKEWVGGKLAPEFRETWALFFSKYLDAYKNEGIDIWGFTVENEPHGNGNNWESMLYSPKEMTDFVRDYLGPSLEKNGHGDKIILGYDQNRAGLKEWVDEMYKDGASAKYFDGTAIHWYESTYEVFPEALQYAHKKAPTKYLIETEGCVDSEVPAWKDDKWYWSKEATDWGWDWASEKEKYLHPKYAPAHRYARDIIGCLNNHVDGWVDWNMVLDRQGGPNWFKNWCVAPVIVDPDADEVYYTPIYYVMTHFSRFIRPGAVKIGAVLNNDSIQATALQNPDKSIVVVLFNEKEEDHTVNITLGEHKVQVDLPTQSLQTIVIKPE